MGLFKRFGAKLEEFAAGHSSSSASFSGVGSPQIPFGTRPPGSGGGRPKTDIMELRDKFIIRNPSTGQLEVEGTGEVIRFASLCAPELFDNEGFEKDDTMQTIRGFGRWPVTRTYTLKVKSKNIGKGHINGWDAAASDFVYDEDMFRSIDYTIDAARKEGVRLIIPIINQDYGSEETNWVGNQTDLIRHRRGFCSWEEAKKVDWWTDPECMDSMLKITTKLLTRTNHITGVRLCDDPTVLAWETGNEMNCGGMRPAPGAWTIAVAEHIKKLAPKTLVMDGSFARTDDVSKGYPLETLKSDAVDIMSWHYYGYGEKRRVKADVEIARKYGKVFVAGEYGFFSQASEFASFLSLCDSVGVSGSLAWSLRPHSAKGGFKTHGEGSNIWSYHAPGWPPAGPEWDHREQQVIWAIRQSAFALTRDPVPPHPVPSAPQIIFPTGDRSGRGAFSWQGGAWAATYEVWVNASGGQEDMWEFFQGNLTDNLKGGQLNYPSGQILQAKGCGRIHIMMRGVSVEGMPGPFSNIVEIG